MTNPKNHAGIVRLDQRNLDGWENAATELGISNADKTLGAVLSPVRCSFQTLLDLYAYDPTCRKICRKPAESALKDGVELGFADAENERELSTIMAREFQRLSVEEVFANARGLERASGGALIWIGFDDDSDLRGPPKAGAGVNWLTVIDASDAEPAKYEAVYRSPMYRQPTSYYVTRYEPHGSPSDGESFDAKGQQEIHASRLLVFPGGHVSARERSRMNGWGISTLNLVYSTVRRHAQVWQSAGLQFIDRGFGIMKVQDLDEILDKEGGEEAMRTRARVVARTMSAARVLLMGGQDDYIHPNPNFGSVPEMIHEFMHEVAHVSDMPVTELFGQSAAGMNASGEGDRKSWHAVVSRERKHMEPRLLQLARVIGAQSDIKVSDEELESATIKWPELEELSALEESQMRLNIANADSIYEQMNGGLTGPEIVLSRFRPEGYSTETVIERELREDYMKQMAAFDAQASPPSQQPGEQGGEGES